MRTMKQADTEDFLWIRQYATRTGDTGEVWLAKMCGELRD